MNVPGAFDDPQRVRTVEVSLKSTAGSVDAYLATPAAPETHPGLVLIHEAFGPNEHIHDLARRFANAGFLTVAPNLYTRNGTPASDARDDVMAAIFGLSDADAIADLTAAATFLRTLDECSGKVGTIGFCSGGRHVLLLALSNCSVDAAIDCWGGYIDRATVELHSTSCRPVPPTELLEQLQAPLLLVGGADDTNPSPDLYDQSQIRHGLRLAASGHPVRRSTVAASTRESSTKRGHSRASDEHI